MSIENRGEREAGLGNPEINSKTAPASCAVIRLLLARSSASEETPPINETSNCEACPGLAVASTHGITEPPECRTSLVKTQAGQFLETDRGQQALSLTVQMAGAELDLQRIRAAYESQYPEDLPDL